jgi:hypothetical protein
MEAARAAWRTGPRRGRLPGKEVAMLRVAAMLLCCTLLVAAAPPRPQPAPKAVGLADLLALSRGGYEADPYLRAVESLQAMGKVKALKLLRELAAKEKDKSISDRTVILCRMLFKAKPGSTFRSPRIGGGMVVGNANYEHWPTYPIEIVDGVPFLIAKGYIFRGGVPESPADYLRYCEEQCDWNTKRFRRRSKEEKRKALDKLMSSPKLMLKLEKDDGNFLRAQVGVDDPFQHNL